MREAGEADLVIFTDGSAEEGVRRGGAGGGRIRRRAAATQLVGSSRGCLQLLRGRTHCNDGGGEMAGGGRPPWSSAVIATDSRSLVDALGGAGAEPHVTALRRALWSLEEKGRSVTLVWVPGHCGVPGNEEADRLAAEGNTRQQEEIPIDGSTRRALIRREVRGCPVRHERLRGVHRRTERGGGGPAAPSGQSKPHPLSNRPPPEPWKMASHGGVDRGAQLHALPAGRGGSETPLDGVCGPGGPEETAPTWQEHGRVGGATTTGVGDAQDHPESPRWLTTTTTAQQLYKIRATLWVHSSCTTLGNPLDAQQLYKIRKPFG